MSYIKILRDQIGFLSLQVIWTYTSCHIEYILYRTLDLDIPKRSDEIYILSKSYGYIYTNYRTEYILYRKHGATHSLKIR